MRVGLIGATGWLGSALGKHLLERGIVAPGDLTLLNRSGPRADYHGCSSVNWAGDVAGLVAQSDVIVVSVRPGDWSGLGLRAEGKLLISFMAGMDFSRLAESGGRIVRAMPNAAAEIGASYSPFWPGPGVTEGDKSLVRRVLSAIGTTDELPDERQIDLMTALPGSGAAYPTLMALAMVDFMRSQGVSEDVAWRASEAAVCGGARMLMPDIRASETLLAAYRDYRGTTAAGLEAAEAAGFSASIAAALKAAAEAARRL